VPVGRDPETARECLAKRARGNRTLPRSRDAS